MGRSSGFIDAVVIAVALSVMGLLIAPVPGASGQSLYEIRLSPADAGATTGAFHTVKAFVLASSPDPGVASPSGMRMLFSVTGATTITGSCQLGNFPECTFSYQGPIAPGADLITGCLDVNNDGAAKDEPCATATVAWLMPPALSTPGQVTGGGQVPNASGTDQSAFGFSAKMATNGGLDGQCTMVDPSTQTTIRCLDVTYLAVDGNHAIIMGLATVNGVATRYRIDANDLSEPGKDKDTFTIRTDPTGSLPGYTVGGVLMQGNIQIRR